MAALADVPHGRAERLLDGLATGHLVEPRGRGRFGLHDRVLEGQALAVLAAVELDLGEHHRAAEHARQALSIQRETGHRLGQARSLVVLGHALRRTGADSADLPCWQEALALFTEAGSPDADAVGLLLQASPATAG